MVSLAVFSRRKELARERVAILSNVVWHSAVIDFGCVWIKFMLSMVKVCVVVGYCPSEGSGKERKILE